MKVNSICTVLLLGTVALALAQTLPEWPKQFSTQMEINLIERNETVRRAEYYDYINNKERIDYYGEHGSIIEILDVDNGARYELRNFTKCSVHPLNGTFSNRIDGISHHLKNSSYLFHISADATYLGTDTARGIICDTWYAEVNEVYDQFEPAIAVNYTLVYYYSVNEWTIQEGFQAEHKVPIRIESVGTMTFLNGSDPQPFEHIYEIVFFEIGQPSHWVFDLVENFFECGSLQNHSLPTLPSQWETAIEVTDIKNNLTTTVYEYYDYPNNRIRVDFVYHNIRISEIMDFDNAIQYEIIDGACTISTINTTEFSHIENSSYAFRFGPGFDEFYAGIRYIRDIPTELWVSKQSEVRDGVTYNMTFRYYFSIEEWTMIDTSSHRIPIRTEIDELAIFPNGTTETYKFSYNFFHWRAHQPDASHFVPHGNQICKSKDHNSSQPIPSFPENYSTGIEFSIINKNYTGFMNEYYDHSNNRIAIDLNFGGTHVQSIILLDDQIEYIVTNESRCVTRKYNENNFFGGSLQSSSEFLHFGKQFQEEYQGVRTVRGIPCDHWISVVDGNFNNTRGESVYMNYTIDYYWSVADWKIQRFSRRNETATRTPVQVVTRGYHIANGTQANFNHIYDFINFRAGVPDEVFIPKMFYNCPNIHSTLFVLQLNANRSELNVETLRKNLGNLLSVDAHYVVILEINQLEKQSNVLVSVKSTNETASKKIQEKFSSLVSNNQLNVGYPVLASSFAANELTCQNDCSNHGTCHFGKCVCSQGWTSSDCSSQISSSSNNNNDNDDDDDDDDDDNDGGVSAGGAAGLTIMGFVIGTVLGTLIVYLIMRKRFQENIQTSYQMQ